MQVCNLSRPTLYLLIVAIRARMTREPRHHFRSLDSERKKREREGGGMQGHIITCPSRRKEHQKFKYTNASASTGRNRWSLKPGQGVPICCLLTLPRRCNFTHLDFPLFQLSLTKSCQGGPASHTKDPIRFLTTQVPGWDRSVCSGPHLKSSANSKKETRAAKDFQVPRDRPPTLCVFLSTQVSNNTACTDWGNSIRLL